MLADADFGRAFERVIDNGSMLRNFVQIMRSGVTGGSRSARGRSGWSGAGWSRRRMRSSCRPRSGRIRRSPT